MRKSSKNNRYKNSFKNILMMVTFIYFLVIVFSGNLNNLYMVWNLLLAWIPLEISYFFKRGLLDTNKQKYSKILIILLSILWVLSYHNAPYVITNLVHLNINKYFEVTNINRERYLVDMNFKFNNDLNMWIDFFCVFVGVWIAGIISFVSLYINKQIIMKKYNNVFSWIFVLIVSILSGFNIYLNRFKSINSWNFIMSPYKTILYIYNSIDKITFKFTMIFGGIITITFILTNLLVYKLKD